MTKVKNNCERIKECAFGMFMQYGIKSVSMDEIASALGSSKKTLYNYYKDKNALVEEIIKDILNKNIASCKAAKDKSTDAIHEAFLAMKDIRELFRRMNPLMLYDLKKYYPKGYQHFSEFKNKHLYDFMKDSIERGIKDGLFREDVNKDVVSRFRIESIIIPFTPEFYTKVNERLWEVTEEISCLFLYGMATQKGHKLITKYRTKTN